jgi:hypothetical protein
MVRITKTQGKTESELLESKLEKKSRKPRIKKGDLVRVNLDMTGIFKNPPKYQQEVKVVEVEGDLIDVEYVRGGEIRVMQMKREFLIKT